MKDMYQSNALLTTSVTDISYIDNTKLEPMPYKIYQTGNEVHDALTIFYISDIHLLHHIKAEVDTTHQIQMIAKSLHDQIISESDNNQYVILFGGDISSSTVITKLFYHHFSLLFQFDNYREWRRTYRYRPKISIEEAKRIVDEEIKLLSSEKDRYLRRYRTWRKYTKRHEEMDEERLVELIRKDKTVPQYLPHIIHKIKEIEDDIDYLMYQYNAHIERLASGRQFDRTSLPIFTILGNHELNNFSTVDDAVAEYSDFFEKEKIHFLHNKHVKILSDSEYSRSVLIVGGIGFAKFNEQYNADNICTTTPPLSREEEIVQTDLFIEAYNEALNQSIADNIQLIVLSHYPTYSWLPNTKHNSRCVYFYGHDHRNTEVHDGGVNIYASNQVGYQAKEITFKHCHLGKCYNPFIDYEDGCFPITVEQYFDFYRFNNEYIATANLQKRSAHDTLYMIKIEGFYGFFLVGMMDVFICSGGRIKRINNVKSIEHCLTYFKLMVNKYVNKLWPYRNAQNLVANELKKLGMSGKIHGCIVDIDFENHIMINPFDGKMLCYYSPVMGLAKPYNSFEEFLIHYLDDNQSYIESDTKREEVLLQWAEIKSINGVLATMGQVALPPAMNSQSSQNELTYVGYHGMYDVSRKMHSFQRLFDSNILREWDETLIEKNGSETEELT